MKKLMVIVFAAAVIVSTGIASYAFGPHGGEGPVAGGYCVSYTQLTPEQKANADRFQKEVAPLREEMFEKRSQMRELRAQTSPDWKAIEKLQKDMVELKVKIQKTAHELGFEGNCGQGRGMGMHRRGMMQHQAL